MRTKRVEGWEAVGDARSSGLDGVDRERDPWRVRERSTPATIETARQGAAPPRGGGEEEAEGEGGAGIDPVSMGAVRPPRRQGSA